MQPARVHAGPPSIPVSTEATADSGTPTSRPIVPGPDANERPIARGLEPAAPVPAVEHPTVTVQRHDSYWAIAERTLGDGLRWREILDLNVGRTLPDGSTLAAGDDTLHAGWTLVLPVDADAEIDGVAGPSTTVEAADPSIVVVEEGDNLWTISEDRLAVDLRRTPADPETAPYWREVIDANADRFVHPGNPNIVHPGQALPLPSTGHELRSEEHTSESSH